MGAKILTSALKILSAAFFGFILSFVILVGEANAVTLAKQTQDFSITTSVWQLIQELGNNFTGKAGTFTFRVRMLTPRSSQFDYTAQNSIILDKETNTFIFGCVPAGSSPADRLRGLIFTTEGVPTGFEDVSIDFTCRNYTFIPGHRYLIKLTNANAAAAGGMRMNIMTTAYEASGNDFFTNGGFRYAFDNRTCNAITYIWNSQIANSGCNILSNPKDDLYFKLTDTPPGLDAPESFLDLPWDYKGQGLSFNEAAQAMTSYFDHTYPLLSSGIPEINEFLNQVTTFESEHSTSKNYSSHDGYDYGRVAKALFGEPVLAAADGEATFTDSCSACGNAILINHKNGYQTRYYHLQKEGLITNTLGEKVQVTAGQKIGQVGNTGNSTGAHIHFMVVEDKNKDGSFEDNLPDGVTDPFGWQSKEVDPWPQFEYKDPLGKTLWKGNKSFYLWKNKLDNLDSTLTTNGGVFKNERFTLIFPPGSVSFNSSLTIKSAPIVQNNTLASIGSTILAEVRDSLGNLITDFQKTFTLKIIFDSFDLERYKKDSISIYSSTDGLTWTKEPTTIDWGQGTATSEINHFTYFALMGERIDTTTPTTTPVLEGEKGKDYWFRSDVKVSLDAKDNDGGLGIYYTMFKIGEGDWEVYNEPFSFTNEGHYKIEFYSVDNDENIEDKKLIEFDIDKTLPKISVDATPKFLWPPDGRMENIKITGNAEDANLDLLEFSVEDEYNIFEPTILNFGDIIALEARREGSDEDGRVYIIKAKASDFAGNTKDIQTEVRVHHDQKSAEEKQSKW